MITFHLKRPASPRPTAIFAVVTLDYRQTKLGIGASVAPRIWDAKNQRVKKSATDAARINAEIARAHNDIATIISRLQSLGETASPERIRSEWDLVRGKAERAIKKIGLLDHYQTFIDSLKGKLQEGTLQVHRTARRHLKEFSEAYSLRLDLDRFDVLVFDKLLSYLVNVAKLNNVSAWKVISTIRVFLRHAADNGLTKNKDYEKFTRKKMPRGDASEKVYLTLPELERIARLDLGGEARLDLTRDLLMFQTYTGLRWGDVHRITREHIDGDEICLVTGKNKKSIRIPLLPAAAAVLEKYNHKLPSRSNQRQNDYVKELCQLAKIERPVPVVFYRGVQRIEKTVPKHELIGTHSSKRSFVSILRQHGVTVEAICRITGNSRQSIERYVLKDSEDMASEIVKVRAALAPNAN